MQKQQEINSRNEYIGNLNGFLISAKSFLGEVLQKLHWTESATIVKSNDKSLVTCPVNEGHRVSCDNVDKHVDICRWHQLGYRADDVPFPSPPTVLPISSIAIDKKLQKDIILKAAYKDPSFRIGENVQNREVPQTSDRFFSDFTTDERRALYDHVVSKTAGMVPQLKEFNLTMKPEGQSAPMSREQLMAAERDAKRRRVKHRSAKVHTKSKNYSEVLREVINNQMLGYEDWIRENFGDVSHIVSTEPEKKNTDEAKQEKQEMVWLDWDFRSNPHIRWKHILEKEKRRKEMREKDSKIDVRNHKEEKFKRKRDESSRDERHHHRDKFRKIENEDKHRRNKQEYEVSHSRRKGNEYRRDSNKRKNYSSRKDDHNSRHREDRYDEEGSGTKQCKKDNFDMSYYQSEYKEKSESKCEDEYRSKHKERNCLKYDPNTNESARTEEHSKAESSYKISRSSDSDVYHGFDSDVRIKEENDKDCSYNYSNKSYYSRPTKSKREEDSASTKSDATSDSSQYSIRDYVKGKKLKKSKKKRKHKSKKKLKQ